MFFLLQYLLDTCIRVCIYKYVRKSDQITAKVTVALFSQEIDVSSHLQNILTFKMI